MHSQDTRYLLRQKVPVVHTWPEQRKIRFCGSITKSGSLMIPTITLKVRIEPERFRLKALDKRQDRTGQTNARRL